MVPRWKLEETLRRRATTNLDDIRRLLRLGMGPCQGGFCIYRATGILHGLDGLTAEQADESLRTSSRSAGRGCGRSSTATSYARRGSTTGSFRACSAWSIFPAMSRSELHYDAVVIGARHGGTGRRCAARRGRRARLRAGQGRRARPISRPARSTCSATRPSASSLRARRCGSWSAARPDHPYALLGPDTVDRGAEVVSGQPWPPGRCPATATSGSLDRNRLLPSAIGALRPSALVPETMASGDAHDPARVCVVGSRALRDFHPALCAANLTALGHPRARRGHRTRGRPGGRERARAGAPS